MRWIQYTKKNLSGTMKPYHSAPLSPDLCRNSCQAAPSPGKLGCTAFWSDQQQKQLPNMSFYKDWECTTKFG